MTDNDTAPGAELLALQQVARIVSRGEDAESRIQDILRHLASALGLVRGRVMLADPAAGEIYIRYAHGLTPAELERGRYRVGEGVSGQVFRTGEAALVANIHDEPGYLARAVDRGAIPPEQIAFLAVPIVRDHLPVGVLAAHRLRNPARSARADLALLEVVATLIAQILCAEAEAQPWVAPLTESLMTPPMSEPQSVGGRCPETDRESRDLTLRLAQQRHTEGRLHQAVDLYLKVAGAHAGTDQALLAKSKLIEVARYYEGRGATRLAADVLDRLQRALDAGRPAEAARRTDTRDDLGSEFGGFDLFRGGRVHRESHDRDRDYHGTGGIGVPVR